jgi:cobalt-zinc-cadmium efflux system outer membrane protein
VPGTAALSEDDAVAVALWNSAQLRADLAQLGFSRADLADAAALPNPNLSFLFPVGTRQLELSLLYPVSLLVQRPWRIASAKLDVERAARALVQSGLDTARDVRVAWAELEACGRRKRLRQRSLELLTKSADLARSRHENGDVSALEADLVKADALAAAELADRAVREERLATLRLRMLVGLAESPLGEGLGARPADVELGAPPPLSTMEKTALASRPDLRAAELGVEAASERAGLEKSKILQLFARLDAKPVGSGGGPPLLFLPGLTADLPIFSQNPGGRARAEAELERAAWLYLTARQQIVTEVRVAREELVMAQGSRAPWSGTIVPLQEKNVTAALRAYESGAESYLVVLEATRKLIEANLRELELGLDVRRAWARLDRAVGWRMHASS